MRAFIFDNIPSILIFVFMLTCGLNVLGTVSDAVVISTFWAVLFILGAVFAVFMME